MGSIYFIVLIYDEEQSSLWWYNFKCEYEIIFVPIGASKGCVLCPLLGQNFWTYLDVQSMTTISSPEVTHIPCESLGCCLSTFTCLPRVSKTWTVLSVITMLPSGNTVASHRDPLPVILQGIPPDGVKNLAHLLFLSMITMVPFSVTVIPVIIGWHLLASVNALNDLWSLPSWIVVVSTLSQGRDLISVLGVGGPPFTCDSVVPTSELPPLFMFKSITSRFLPYWTLPISFLAVFLQ